jgi:hypothetical protein
LGWSKTEICLRQETGLASITMKLEDLGMPDLPDEKKLEILNKVKMLSLKKKALSMTTSLLKS